jgi:AsmA-like protein
MSNFVVAIAVFLITVLGALFAVPYFVDWNGYRSAFEEEATRLLGREVRVGGAVNLHLLPSPYFRFEKVRIADTSVNLQEPFFRTDSLTIKLAIPPMIRGVVEANEIELQRPVLRLALDSGDGWNWQSFGQALGKAAYLPANVALTSVKIVDGMLAVHAPDGVERTRFEGFNGEFSAPALDGPYRLRGTFGKPGAEREFRINTARPEADGAVRFKAILRVGDGASTYTLDGRLADITGKPRIEGELSARLPFSGLWQAPPGGRPRGQNKATGPDGETGSDKTEAAFDLRAAVRADPAGATLTDLALAFEQDGRPQLISGELRAIWRDALAVEMSLASRWLDLDRIAGASEDAGPLESIIPLAIGMRDLLPADSRSRATFSVDQANIGREAVSALRLSLVRSADKLVIEELRAGLPGGSRGELQGVVTGPPDAPAFEGSIGLRGTSLVRFLGWATAGALTFDAKGDGTFGVRSQLSIAPGRAAARNIIGDLSGTAISADLQYRWDGRPAVSLVVEGPQLDARALVPAGASLGDVFDVVLHGPIMSQSGGPGSAKPGWRGAQTDVSIRVSVGQLITAARTYRDVAMEIELKGGHLRLPLLRIAGDDGFSLELEGDVNDAASRPKGSLRALVGADTGPAIAPLAELLGIPETFRPDARRARAMVPLRLAGSLAFGARTPTSADLVLDGEANGAGVKLNARLDGGPAGWRTGPADVTGLVEGNDAQVIAALLAPGGSPSRGERPGSGRMMVKAVGVPAEGLASLVSAETGDLALDFRGQIFVRESGNSATGNLDIRASDGARLASLTGLAPPLRLEGLPIAGSVKLSVDSGTLALDRLALKIAGGDVNGQLSLAAAGERRRVEGRLDFDELSVAKLLGLLQDQRLSVTAVAETAISGRQSVWSDEPFDASVLDAFEGNIKLNAKRLVLAEGMGLSGVSLDVALQGGKVEVRQLEGAGLGGRCSATLSIAKAAAGVDVSGSLSLAGGTIESLTGNAAGQPRASGVLGGEIKFSGKGTSPRSVLSVLQGSGTLSLGEARLGALWPGAVGKAVEAALKSDPDSLAAILKRTLAAGLADGELQLPGTVSVEIADGRLAAKPFVIATDEGRAQGVASLDLKTLQFDADWRLDQKRAVGAGDKAPLPGITVSYRGPVTSLAGLQPRIDSDALERELAVRRMERDLEELERLRKLDEARRREDSERQRRQLEQAPPPVPVPMAPAGRPATPG